MYSSMGYDKGADFLTAILSFFGIARPALCGDTCKEEYYSKRPIRKVINIIVNSIFWLLVLSILVFIVTIMMTSKGHH
jgi:hypothetical protein